MIKDRYKYPGCFLVNLNEKRRDSFHQQQAAHTVAIYWRLTSFEMDESEEHSDIKTPIIDTSTVNMKTIKESKSPLDF